MGGAEQLGDGAASVSADRGRPTAAAVVQSSSATSSPSSPSLSNSTSPASPSSPPLLNPTSPPPAAAYAEAVSRLSVTDVSTLHTKPCARESLLTGIGTGFGVGGLRFILASGGAGPWQARQWRAMSWAVGAFVLASGGAHMFCQRRRLLEKQAMARATAIMEEKRRLKIEEAERARERRRQELEREEREGGLWKWVGWR